MTAASGVNRNNNRFSFAAAWGDYNADGYPDLAVANDFGRKNLYRNNGDGTFTDVAAAAGVEDPGAGMSVAWGDYDGDGRLDLYTGNMWSSAGQRLTHNPAFANVATDARVRAAHQRQARGNSLFRNNGDGAFRDVTFDAGVGMGRWAWSSGFIDFDNDGREDIYVQNGYITGAIALAPKDPKGYLNLAIYYRRFGDAVQAKRALEDLLKIDPNNQQARQMLR